MEKYNKWLRLMKIGSFLGCHQKPERSFFFKGYQFPVCARCIGVIISSIIAFFVFIKKKVPLAICTFMSLTMLTDWLLQYLNIKKSTNKRRFITGLIGGFGWSTIQFSFYRAIYNNVIRKE